MTSLLRRTRALFRRSQWPKLQFPKTGFKIIDDDCVLEEESIAGFRKGVYYPVNIGDVFASRYQVIAKLGYGITSTVWLARDLRLAALSYSIAHPLNECQR